jgi:hypothetical protein
MAWGANRSPQVLCGSDIELFVLSGKTVSKEKVWRRVSGPGRGNEIARQLT